MRLLFALLPLALGIFSARSAPPSATIAVAQRFIEVWNRRDIDAIVESMTSDFVWYNVTSDSTAPEVTGRDALRDFVTRYFARVPDARSEGADFISSGAFVSFRETARWTDAAGKHEQETIAVYEVSDGKIKRAWYYPFE